MAKRIQKICITENELKNIINESVRVIMEDKMSSEPIVRGDEIDLPLSRAQELAADEIRGFQARFGENEVEFTEPETGEIFLLVIDLDGYARSRLTYRGSTPSGGPDPDDYEDESEIDSLDAYFVDIDGEQVRVSDDFLEFIEDNIEIDQEEFEAYDPADDYDDEYDDDDF